ncbi:aminoglycoside 6-adenylyltransferase [Cytobacillus praedii]|uniref:aminoglycoside 6-adenylyltransferase n=1 Tax=Cytobacillus praedii TaxID=1742358 RepID=UPI002E1E2C08|nr:aminoglycoside 6-adenylyltransferase [Cytobacillus praedii]
MRSVQEMMEIILSIAKKDERIRIVTLEGSRTNKNIPKDKFQDYDISYFVTDIDSFKSTDEWLNAFGKRIIMQKPEDMELFQPELGNWFSYLMLFDDGNKIDLTLIPLDEAESYFLNTDGLVEVLLDKDSSIKDTLEPTDKKFHIKKPSAKEFDDCCNEFWMVSTYVVKGLARKEILFAIDHLNEMARPNLLRMMSWYIGIETNFSLSLGKNYKYLQKHLDKNDWDQLLYTFAENSYENMWQSLFNCYDLFRKYSKLVANKLCYDYPVYDEQITTYTQKVYHSLPFSKK